MSLAFAASAPVSARSSALPFARLEVAADLASQRAVWLELEGAGGAYQSYRFAELAIEAMRAQPSIVVARDEDGSAVALLPLHVNRYGPLRVARFIGDAWSNYHMGLFRRGIAWERRDVEALLSEAARQAGVDLFAFNHQPAQWEGVDNPLALVPGAPSANAAFASALPCSHQIWLDGHFSRVTQKKLRKKSRKLEAFGPVVHRRADGEAEGVRFLDAFFAHRAAQALARGEEDGFARPQVQALLRRFVAGETPLMEMHALLAGDRVVAAFGALSHARRLSGLIVSYDGAPEAAASTPGELLLIEVVREAIDRGFRSFDLGVGESRYKSEICEFEEPLTDMAYAATPLGRVAARFYLAQRAALGWIKRRPALLRPAQRLRRAFG